MTVHDEGLGSLETHLSYLTAKFKLGELTRNKADPAAVARSMQCGLCGYDTDFSAITEGGFPLSRDLYVRAYVNFNWLYVCL